MSDKNQDVYIGKMSAFSRMLRREGLAVGPQETADACRILAQVGLENRETVKTVLRTVYASSREEQIAFDRVFDGFFISEERMRAQAREKIRKEKEEEAQRKRAQEQLQEHGAPEDLSPEEVSAYMLMSDEARKRLNNTMDTYNQNSGVRGDSKLYANFIHSVFARSILEQQMQMEDAGLGGYEQDPQLGILYRDISQMNENDIPKMTAMIQKLSAQISGELDARKKKAGSSGKLDFRRTIRRGLQTGGSLYSLAYRRNRNRKRQLVMVCDVSGSMIQFSEFALRLIRELGQAAESSRIFLFSEQTREADAFSLQNMDKFREYVSSTGLYGRGTDLGTALETILGARPSILNGSTTLVIVSDAKTIDQNRAVADLRAAKRQAGQVLWLNPIPESKWRYLNSSRTFAAECPMLSISNLKSLGYAVRRLTV